MLQIHRTNWKEMEMWRLRSQSVWLQAGDKNTTYFHRQTKVRHHKRIELEIILEDGYVLNIFPNIKEAAKNDFEQLQNEENPPEFQAVTSLLENIPSLISNEDNENLNKYIEEQEIIQVIWGLALDKAPRSYGFSIHFYQACWNFIKKYLICMLHYS